MAKLRGQGDQVDGEDRIKAEVAAVLDEFGGDARAAILALLRYLAALSRETDSQGLSGRVLLGALRSDRRRRLQ
ncbi:hypothetical protein [Phreatobacter stygius]|uniref:Uncharacterized protein n=1 Tax=Phreatobacter stygius TaxID=1940610 RepID=A0A4D7BG97_9HYPH|nr:hypothetical protein [Phreatobacter stygius]QCI66882.1 hypothetical protein E8M01_23125 [Phreatobacter stygius]